MNQKKQYQANPDVSCGDEEDGAVLYNPDTDRTSMVNLSGRALWTLLQTPRTEDEMTAYLLQHYSGVTAEQAAEDVRNFIETLLPDFVLEASDEQ